MCESAAEGGKRCAAHTRPQFTTTMTALRESALFNRGKIRTARSADGETTLMIVRAHASTPAGLKEVDLAIKEFKELRDVQTGAWLTTARKFGVSDATATAEVRKTIKKVAFIAKRKEEKWLSPAKVSPVALADPSRSLLAVHPELGEQMKPELNNGIGPDQVTPGQNIDVAVQCEKGHIENIRLSNVTHVIQTKGTLRRCKTCRGPRQKSLESTQQSLREFAESMGGDPDAWESLAPATRYALMARAGMLGKDRSEFERSTALAMAHDDLTLREVLAAKRVQDMEDRVNDQVTDDDADADREISMSSGAAPSVDPADDGKWETRIDRVMASSGAAAFAAGDSELIDQVVRDNVETLWNEVHNQPGGVDALLERVNNNADRNPFRQRVADEFTDEVTRVRAAALPEGYSTKRVRANGDEDEVEPLLSQRRFQLRAEDERRIMNLSGTGAGKTLSAVLAARASGAQETLVVAPLVVTGQWKDEFEQAFPGTDIRMGLPGKDEDLSVSGGHKRVWIVNYDKLSGDPEELEERLAGLRARVGAVVLDEVHLVKQTDGVDSSLRREALQSFMAGARDTNPDLMVVGQSATPVVNDLSEAKSLLQIVTGEDHADLKTDPTIKNAASVFRSLSRHGVRWRPAYPSKLTKLVVTVDVSRNLPAIQARLEVMRKAGDSGRVSAAMMERALLPEKLPAVVAAVRQSEDPTVVYSDYVDGMVDPIIDRMRAEGFTAERYTGSEPVDVRADTLRRFQRGEIRVLVGSRPIATGVDGIQRVSHNSVVVSPPQTAMVDDQFVGRSQRTGQAHDVTVTYIKTEAKAGDLSWSWCQTRLNRLKFKRSLADAAVDGVVPDGHLGSQEKAVGNALAQLQQMSSEAFAAA